VRFKKNILIRIFMNKLAVSAFAILLCWSGSSLYARHHIETAYPQRLAELSNNNALGLHVKKHSFDAGAFSSVASTEFEFKSNACAESPNLRFTIEERFRHDLISGLGSVKSDINIIIHDKNAEKAFNSIAGKIKKDPLVITGTYSLFGNKVNYDITSPAFNINGNAGDMIDWGGMTGKITLSNDIYAAHFNSPKLTLSDTHNRNFSLLGLKFDQDGTHTAIGVDAGKSSLLIDSLELYGFKQGVIPNVMIEKINFNQHTKLNGNLIDMLSENSINQIKVGKLIKNGSLSSKFALNHLDAQGLSTFNKAFNQIRTTCKANFADFDKDLKAVLKGSPELVVEQIKLSMGDVAFAISGHIKGANLDKMQDNAVDALRKIDGLDGLDIKLQLNANDAAIAPSFSQILERFINADILTRQANGYSLDILYKNAELKFNELSLNDLKLALSAPADDLQDAYSSDEEAEEEPTNPYPDWYDPNRIY
jgi:uncharacterized protein YdgA (DUF945 family)